MASTPGNMVVAAVFLLSFHLGQSDIDLSPVLSFVKLRISEFPPISNSPVNTRSLAVFNNTESLASLQAFLNSLTILNSKVYIEVRPSSISEFISFLNLTSLYIQSVLWTPCVMLHWPERITVAEAEAIVLLIVGLIEKDDFPLDSEVYVAFEIKRNTPVSSDTRINESLEVVLCDLFKYKREITSTSQFCHVRHLDKPLSVSEGYFSYHPVSTRRRDFNGTVLNIIAQYDPSYEERLVLREFGNGSVEFTRGMCLDLLVALQIAMNFSYVPMKGNGWMGQFPNGTWTGMTAQLFHKEADLSIAQASMIMMIDNLPAISFLHVSSLGQLVAIFKQPTSSVNLTLSAFSKQSWLFYLLIWIAILASVRLAYFVQTRIYDYDNFSSTDLAFIRELVSWAMTTICTRGWYIHPSNLCFRVICLVASVTAFCIYAAYSSQLTVILVTEVLPIKSFTELSRSSLEIFTDKWLPVARNLIEKVYNQRGASVPTENSKTVDDGLQEVITKGSSLAFVTFVDSIPSVYYKMNLSDNFFCDSISSVTVASQRTPTAMFLKRGSPLKEILNYNILNLVETGVMRRINLQYEDKTQMRCAPKHNNYRGGLSLEDVLTPFFLLTFGFTMCIVHLIFETLWSRKFS